MCVFCSRRDVLTGAASALIVAATADELLAQSTSPSPCAWNRTGEELQRRTSSTSGDRRLDSALIAELKQVMGIIPIYPGFLYLDEPNGPNAFASRETIIPETKGTVYIGLKLINLFMQKEKGGIAVAGICAHECGHIYQYFSEFEAQLRGSGSSMLLELHADFIAGYYMGTKWSTSNVTVFSDALYNTRDYDFNNRDHHGNPGQRVAAMLKGYRLAQDSNRVSIHDAARVGETYVKSL